jgi:hypothetical protein
VPKISFMGVIYDSVDQMPPDVRAQYFKVAQTLPDTNGNGIPDLLEREQGLDFSQSVVSSDVSSGLFGSGLPGAAPVPARKGISCTRLLVYVVLVLLVISCLCLGGAAAIFYYKTLEVQRLAVDIALKDSTVQEVLGTPITSQSARESKYEDNGVAGSASMRIPLNGSRQSGMLVGQAVKENGIWYFASLVLEVGDKRYPIRTNPPPK